MNEDNKIQLVDEEMKQRVFQQVMDIWVNPEIKARREKGTLPNNFSLRGAQVIFSRNQPNQIRINEEVKAILTSVAKRDIKKGEAVYEADIGLIEKVNLTDEDKNCSHITLLLIHGRWIIAFDSTRLYNNQEVNRAREYFSATIEFYQSAKENLLKNRLRAFYENCYAAIELCTSSILVISIDEKNISNHENRKKELKNWVELGKVKKEFSDTLEKLNDLRYSYRYLHSDDFKRENPDKILIVLDEMIKFAENSIK